MRQFVPRSPADALSWLLIGSLFAICLVLNHGLGLGVPLARAILPGLGLAALLAALMLGRSREDARLVAGATAFLQMTLFTILGIVTTFLLAARAGPLWDTELLAADARLGLAWPTIFHVADRMPRVLLLIGGTAYHSLVAQMVFCIVALASTDRLHRLRITVAAAILSGVVTVLVSGIVPALGNVFDPDRYSALWPSVAWLDRDLILGLRDGSLRQIDLSHMTGIVSFPSYHATLAMILAWGLRPIAKLRVPAALWATLTVVATPLFGGHYVVDVLAGLVLAAGALGVAVWIPSQEDEGGRVRPCSRHGKRLCAAELAHIRGTECAGVSNDLV